jgi:hypothetical protein
MLSVTLALETAISAAMLLQAVLTLLHCVHTVVHSTIYVRYRCTVTLEANAVQEGSLFVAAAHTNIHWRPILKAAS